jgi:hypothetical protein
MDSFWVGGGFGAMTRRFEPDGSLTERASAVFSGLY